MARIKPISREIDILVSKHLSREAQQDKIAAFAKDVIKKADDHNARVVGARVPYEVRVDGRLDAPLNSVRPDGGVILANWDMLNEIVEYVLTLLVRNSPVLTGRYRASHTIFADGDEVDSAEGRTAREWAIMSSVPYARKIERGQGGSVAVYDTAAQMANRRYGNIASIKYTYLDWKGGQSMFTDWLNGRDYRLLGKNAARRQFNKDSRQPTVVISYK